MFLAFLKIINMIELMNQRMTEWMNQWLNESMNQRMNESIQQSSRTGDFEQFLKRGNFLCLTVN